MMKWATALLLGAMVIPVLGCGNTARLEAIEKAKAKLELAESDLVENEKWFEEFGDTPPTNDAERIKLWAEMESLLEESQERVAEAKKELRELVDPN